MNDQLNKLLQKPKSSFEDMEAKYEKFNLIENPFPSEPYINKESDDIRVNGKIYEYEIRKKEFENLKKNYLSYPQSKKNHLRLCYILDKSYLGRGNGKSAFLLYIQNIINEEYCLNISKGENKCFSLYLRPDSGGRTKTFEQFMDIFFESIINSKMIQKSIMILILQSINQLYPKSDINKIYNSLNNLFLNGKGEDFFNEHKDLNKIKIFRNIFMNDYLKSFPIELRPNISNFLFEKFHFNEIIFINYYKSLKKTNLKIEFIFTHLVRLFLASGFNGAYILVDDFERIPDFQSARQKRDFATELRSCLYDGINFNARIGFYVFVLALHAGVPRILKEAWAESGMENRIPLNPNLAVKHIIPFDKLSQNHAKLLIKKYLIEFRLNKTKSNNALYPFSDEAVSKICEISELNASKILKNSYNLLEEAALDKDVKKIDLDFVNKYNQKYLIEDIQTKSIKDIDTVDLDEKSKTK